MPENPFTHLIPKVEAAPEAPPEPENPFSHLIPRKSPVLNAPQPGSDAFKTGPSYGGTELAGIDIEGLSSKPWRFASGVARQELGAAQALAHGGSYLTSLGGAYPNAVSNSLDDASTALDKWIAYNARVDDAVSERAGIKPGDTDWWRFAGQVASPTNYAGPAGPAGSMLARGAVAGVKYGISEPVNTEARDHPGRTYAGAKTAQVAGAAAGGAIGGKVLDSVGAALAPRISGAVQTLLDAGVRLTPGQIAGDSGGLGGRIVRGLEEKLTSFPVAGDMIQARFADARNDFNRAAWNRALGNIGEQLPRDITTGDGAVAWARDRFGQEYRNILQNARGSYDQNLAQRINGIISSPDAQTLPEPQLDQLRRIIRNQVVDRADRNVGGYPYTPEKMMNVRSELSRRAAALSSSENESERELGRVVWNVHEAFSEMIQRQNPGIAPRLQAADDGFSAFVRPQTAASKAAAAQNHGNFTPGQLNQVVAQTDKSVRKMGYGAGDAIMGDLARSGVQVMRNGTPDSGTPGRLLAAALIGGAGYAAPQTLIPSAATAVAYTRPMQAVIRALLATRPQALRTAGEAIRGAAPYASIPGAAAISENNKRTAAAIRNLRKEAR